MINQGPYGEGINCLRLSYSTNQKSQNSYTSWFLRSPYHSGWVGDGYKTQSWRGCGLDTDRLRSLSSGDLSLRHEWCCTLWWEARRYMWFPEGTRSKNAGIKFNGLLDTLTPLPLPTSSTKLCGIFTFPHLPTWSGISLGYHIPGGTSPPHKPTGYTARWRKQQQRGTNTKSHWSEYSLEEDTTSLMNPTQQERWGRTQHTHIHTKSGYGDKISPNCDPLSLPQSQWIPLLQPWKETTHLNTQKFFGLISLCFGGLVFLLSFALLFFSVSFFLLFFSFSYFYFSLWTLVC